MDLMQVMLMGHLMVEMLVEKKVQVEIIVIHHILQEEHKLHAV